MPPETPLQETPLQETPLQETLLAAEPGWGTAGLETAGLETAGQLGDLWAGPLTDLGNARRLVRAFGSEMRYLPAAKAWLIWDGRRWIKDDTGQVSRFARQVTDLLMDHAGNGMNHAGNEADLAAPPVGLPAAPPHVGPAIKPVGPAIKHVSPAIKAVQQAEVQQALAEMGRKAAGARLAFARRSQSRSRLEAMVTLAQAEPGMAVRPAELDKDPFLLCTRAGTLDLKTGTLRPHRRSDLITKLAPVTYDPAAPCPRWERALARILPDPAVRDFVQRSAGYALTGSTREQCVFFWHGGGRNGKTTVIEALRFVLGDYALETPADTLIAKSGGIPSDLARLAGARFVTARETEDGQKLAESLIKHLSGGDALTARFLFGEWFEFLPALKLFLATNHRPQVRGTDEGIWRRLHLVPFAETLGAAEVDRELPEKLRAEAGGILAWAVRGCLAWQQGGLCPPPAVAAATAEYRDEMDGAGQFLRDRCRFGAGPPQSAGALYRAFAGWAAESGCARVSPQAFAQRLLACGLSKRRGQAGFVWDGIQLLPEEADIIEDPEIFEDPETL